MILCTCSCPKNGKLYEASKKFHPAGTTSHVRTTTSPSQYALKHITDNITKFEDEEVITLVDEDAFIVDSSVYWKLVEDFTTSDAAFAGVPDGVLRTGACPISPNIFFLLLKPKLLIDRLNFKDILAQPVPKLPRPDRSPEPYYKFFHWAINNGFKPFYDIGSSAIPLLGKKYTILDYDGHQFLYHSWWARTWGTATGRKYINGVLNLARDHQARTLETL